MSFWKGFMFAAGIVFFFIILFYFFRPQVLIGPMDSEGNLIVSEGQADNVIYSSVPLKETEIYDTAKLLTESVVILKEDDKSSPYPFKDEIPQNMMNGVRAGLLDYEFQKEGEDWGELKSIKLVIDNVDGQDFFPAIRISVYDNDISASNTPSTIVDVGEWSKVGEYLIVDVPLDLAFHKAHNKKLLKIFVGEGNSYYFENKVNFETEINFLNSPIE